MRVVLIARKPVAGGVPYPGVNVCLRSLKILYYILNMGKGVDGIEKNENYLHDRTRVGQRRDS